MKFKSAEGVVNDEIIKDEKLSNEVNYYATISEKLGNMLCAQKDSEIYNMFLYKKMSLFYKKQGLQKLSDYYFDRGEEEKVHHDWIVDRLEECNFEYDSTPNVKPIEEEWSELIDPFIITLQIERNTTASITEICKCAYEECDYKIVSWLYDRLIPEQHEEESISLSLLKIVENFEDVDWLTIQDTVLDQYKTFRPNPNRGDDD